jgi:hypothetical protein
MAEATVALVINDPALRLMVARAFDDAPQSWRVRFCERPPVDADVVVAEPSNGDGHDVAFDPAHPERLIPEITARLRRSLQETPCKAVAVTGIAGAGVTSIAMHLASIWGRGSTTGFVDLDRSWSCAPRLGLGSEVVTWAAAAGFSPDALRLSSVPVAPGVRALVAPLGDTDVQVGTLVERACSVFQRLVLDVPFGSWDPDMERSVDAVLVVMSPSLPHAHRVARILKEVEMERVAVITNRLGRGGETTRGEIEAIIGCRLTLELPTFPGLRDAEGNERLASLFWSRWGRGLSRLARAVEGA